MKQKARKGVEKKRGVTVQRKEKGKELVRKLRVGYVGLIYYLFSV